MPQKRPKRNGDIRFSPSGVTKCGRELYYYNLDYATEETRLTPWKQRVPRNGEGGHIVTQEDYMKMHSIMTEAGVSCKFKMVATEIIARKEFDVDGVKVVINGRCDGVLEDENGVKYIWEKKTKDKMTNFKKVKEPTEANYGQAVCYSLIFGIPRTIFEYESLQKPKWSEDDAIDQKHFYFEVTPDMEKDLLTDLAEIAEAIEKRVPPPTEPEKCMFCSYKKQCAQDGR
jgi:CRISPR/Cas system-associated exonuclease Cas4 (RecB family)